MKMRLTLRKQPHLEPQGSRAKLPMCPALVSPAPETGDAPAGRHENAVSGYTKASLPSFPWQQSHREHFCSSPA